MVVLTGSQRRFTWQGTSGALSGGGDGSGDGGGFFLSDNHP